MHFRRSLRAVPGLVATLLVLGAPAAAQAETITRTCIATAVATDALVLTPACTTPQVACPAGRSCTFNGQVDAAASHAVGVPLGVTLTGSLIVRAIAGGPQRVERQSCASTAAIGPRCSRATTGSLRVTSPTQGASSKGDAGCSVGSSLTAVLLNPIVRCTLTVTIS